MSSDHTGHDGASDLGGRLGAWDEGKERGLLMVPQLMTAQHRHDSKASPWSVSAEEARIDWIMRKTRSSTLAGHNWATSPKVKMYLTCKEKRFGNKNYAK